MRPPPSSRTMGRSSSAVAATQAKASTRAATTRSPSTSIAPAISAVEPGGLLSMKVV